MSSYWKDHLPYTSMSDIECIQTERNMTKDLWHKWQLFRLLLLLPKFHQQDTMSRKAEDGKVRLYEFWNVSCDARLLYQWRVYPGWSNALTIYKQRSIIRIISGTVKLTPTDSDLSVFNFAAPNKTEISSNGRMWKKI